MHVSLLGIIRRNDLCRLNHPALTPRFVTFLYKVRLHSLKTLSLAAAPLDSAPAHGDYVQSIDYYGLTGSDASRDSNVFSSECQRIPNEDLVFGPEISTSRHIRTRSFSREQLIRRIEQEKLGFVGARQSSTNLYRRFRRCLKRPAPPELATASGDNSRYGVRRPVVITSHKKALPKGLAWRRIALRNGGKFRNSQRSKQNTTRRQPLFLKLLPGTMARLWSKYPMDLRHRTWDHFVRRAVLSSPNDAILVLKDVMEDMTTNLLGLKVAECLNFLTFKLLDGSFRPSKELVKAIYDVVYHFLFVIYSPSGKQTWYLRRIVFKLSRLCEYKDFYSLWEMLQEKSVPLPKYAKEHFMHRLINMKKAEAALSMLSTVDREDYSSDQIQSICVRILRCELDVEDLYDVRSKMLARMLESGVRPNRQLHNVIILNAMEAGDWDTGWRCHQIALAYGLKPDSYTYAILLKSAEDRATIEDLRQSAIDDGIDVNTPRMATEFFIATYFCVRQGPDRWKFADFLSHYQVFFDVQPLIDLEIVEPFAIAQPEHASAKVKPHAPALGIVLLAYLRETSDNYLIPRIYQNYRRLVRQGDPTIGLLAETTYISDGFVKALGKNRSTLHLCTSVLEDMLKPGAPYNQNISHDQGRQDRALENPSSKPLNIHPPSFRTWSVLMRSFLQHKQINAAEKVLSMMRARRVWPDTVTWNTLINGYCHDNDSVGAAWTLRRMKEDGFERDERTTRFMYKVSDRKKLMEALQEIYSGKNEREERPEGEAQGEEEGQEMG